MMDYEKLLDKGLENLPESVLKRDRFNIPKVRGHIQGNRTVISNFHQIADTLGRSSDHLLKAVLKELASPGELTKTGVIIGSKVPASRVNQRIKEYAEKYVFCRECGKPDTKLTKENKINFLRCSACGAKYAVA